MEVHTSVSWYRKGSSGLTVNSLISKPQLLINTPVARCFPTKPCGMFAFGNMIGLAPPSHYPVANQVVSTCCGYGPGHGVTVVIFLLLCSSPCMVCWLMCDVCSCAGLLCLPCWNVCFETSKASLDTHGLGGTTLALPILNLY